jgi:hypothetical protein
MRFSAHDASLDMGHWGIVMLGRFVAHSLLETRVTEDEHRFELTFVSANGSKHTVSIPSRVAADLMPVLASLASRLNHVGGPKFTRMPKQCAVGQAVGERLVLIKFDDEPPYGLPVEEAEALWRELREESEDISRQRCPGLQ